MPSASYAHSNAFGVASTFEYRYIGITMDNVVFRCIRATEGKFNITYTTLAECATSNVVYDVYFGGMEIRMIARGTGRNHGGAQVQMAGANMWVVQDRVTKSVLKTTYRYTDLTVIKYIDDVPVDMPLDDPAMHMTRNTHSSELKKYLAVWRKVA